MDLRTWREAHGMNRDECAMAAGTSAYAVSAAENGRRKLDEGLYALVAQVSGQDVADAILRESAQRARGAAQRIRERLLQQAAV